MRRQVEIAERTRDAALIDTLVVSLKSRATGGKRYAALHKRVLDLNPAQPLKREDPAPWQRDKSSDMPVSIAKQVLRFEQEFRSAAAEIKVNSVSQNSNSVREKLRQEELKYTRKVRRVTGSSSPLETLFRMARRSAGVRPVKMGGFNTNKSGLGLSRGPEFQGGQQVRGGLPGSKR